MCRSQTGWGKVASELHPVTVSGSFRASQSFYLPSSCSHCASIKAFITSRNWLKTWTCISGPFCAPEAACACLAGLWRDEMRWDGLCHLATALLRSSVTKWKAPHLGIETLIARKVLGIVLWSALIVLITALLHITASVHVLAYILSSSVLQAQKRYNYSTSFLFKFPAGIFSAWNQCLPLCLWNFLRK